MGARILALGAFLCAAAVAAGAFGAHGLRARFDARQLELWETAARYLMYGGLGVLALTLAELVRQRPVGLAPALLAAGAAVFAGTVFALALGGPRWLGAITPLGGAAMIAAFLLFVWRALR
ncbi:MAG: DUF423 domain-containing protein [Thermoanaerobaculia bacterium]